MRVPTAERSTPAKSPRRWDLRMPMRTPGSVRGLHGDEPFEPPRPHQGRVHP